MKLGRCIKELERIYGVREGSANNKEINVSEKFSFTQKDLSDELGIDERTMQNYKKLTELIPELEDLVDTGILAPTTELVSPKVSDSPNVTQSDIIEIFLMAFNLCSKF